MSQEKVMGDLIALLRHMQCEPASFDVESVASAAERAADALAALRRELEAEKARFEEHHAAWLENHKYLAGRVRELEVDAARYRWLRDKSEYAPPVNGYMTWPVTGHDHTDAHPVFGADLDTAVDAARAADAGERT